MKKITFLFFMLTTLSISAENLLLTNFEDVTCTLGVSGGWGSTWTVADGVGKVTVPANNQGNYIVFALPANFDASKYSHLKVSIKSTETNYRFIPEYLKADWSGSADWNNGAKYTGNGAWQDVFISLSALSPATPGAYVMVDLKVAAYDNKPSFDMYIDNVTLIEKYVPDLTKNVTITDFDNILTTIGGWGGNTLSIATNPDGIGNGGLVSVPANNSGAASLIIPTKIDPATHNKITFKVYGTQNININYIQFEDKDNNTIKKSLPAGVKYTTPNAWQTLTLDLSSLDANKYNKMMLATEAWQNKPALTYYIDDVVLVNNNVTGVESVSDNDMIAYFILSKTLKIKTDKAAVVEVFNLAGMRVCKENVQGESDVNVSNLNSGVYLVRVSGDGINSVKKILVK